MSTATRNRSQPYSHPNGLAIAKRWPRRSNYRDNYNYNQPQKVINARLNNASHDFPTTEKLVLTTLRNSYHLSPNRNNRPRARTTALNHRPIDALVSVGPIDASAGLVDRKQIQETK